MLFKPDWDTTKLWTAAWLRGEVGDHWALGTLARRTRPLDIAPPPLAPETPRDAWLDIDGNLARREAWFAEWHFGGIFAPNFTASLGPGSLSLFLGAEPRFLPGTVWHEPVYTDPAEVSLCLHPDNPYWCWTLTALQQYRTAALERYLLTMPELLDGLDVLAQLFGTEALLTYLLDCPGEIHRLLNELDELFLHAWEVLYALVAGPDGSTAYMSYQVWGPARTLLSQCDFSAMISPTLFEEFVAPYLARRSAHFDATIYHLDGPDAIKHLPELLHIPSVTAIEWTPGTPNPYATDPVWWDVIWRPVYAAGKSAHVWAVPTEQIHPFLNEFGQAGTLMTTGCDNEDDARRLIDESIDWGR